MRKIISWGLVMILCVGLILLGTGSAGLAQSTDSFASEETQDAEEEELEVEQNEDGNGEELPAMTDNKIVQIILEEYGEKYEVTEEKIQGYRVDNNLGYGNILKLYILADAILEGEEQIETADEEGTKNGTDEQSQADGINGVINEILYQLTANEGWGEIAQENDLKLGKIISSVMKSDKANKNSKKESINEQEKENGDSDNATTIASTSTTAHRDRNRDRDRYRYRDRARDRDRGNTQIDSGDEDENGEEETDKNHNKGKKDGGKGNSGSKGKSGSDHKQGHKDNDKDNNGHHNGEKEKGSK
ncbi:hypothetical protein J7K55_00075 [Candidatus Aerophobetes bacterium]|nr:hypothetical protein [Candidatus Aerophobetes bacterium]